jgi:hypothetical protein
MAARFPQIVRVFLSRPWVWLMAGMGLLQIFPAMLMSRSRASMTPIVVTPILQGPEQPISQHREFTDLLREGRLESVTAIDITDNGEPRLPLGRVRLTPDGKGGNVIESLDGPTDAMLFISPHSMSTLTHLPHLKSLRADLRMFDRLGWERLGQLRELEFLSLRKAGCADSSALDHASTDVPTMLSHLPNLRELDLHRAFSPRISLPPLPKLEKLGIGPLVNLDQKLRKVAEDSPNLQTLILGAYWEHTSLNGLAEALQRMPRLRTVYLMDLSPDSAVRATLSERLPGVAFPRTGYSPARVYGALYLVIACSFPCMIVWLQTLVCFSVAYSHTLPRFRWAHISIPLGVTAILVPASWLLARFLGVAALPAFVLVYCGSLFTTMPQPNLDSTFLGTVATRAVATWRLGLGAALMGLTFANPVLLDAFYTGEYPSLGLFILVVETLATVWGIRRLFRQAPVLAELGQTVIPGLIQLDHFNLQMNPEAARKKKAFLFSSQGADDRLEALLDSRQPSIGSLMRAGTPRIAWGPRLIVLLMMGGVLYLTFRRIGGVAWQARAQQLAPMVTAQAGLVFVMWSFAQWIGRRPMLGMELLRPLSRDRYFRGLWQATAIDLGQIILMILIGALAGLIAHGFGLVTWILAALALGGLLLTLQAFLLWAMTARRLWVPLTVGMFTIVLAAPAVVGLIQLLNGVRDLPPSEAMPQLLGSLAVVLMTVGAGMQYWQLRRWQTVEFS